MRNTLITAAASAALFITPATASASPVNATEFSKTVPHDDPDLTTGEGAARLDERVRTRVRQLCRSGARDNSSLQLERECRASAFAAAQSQVRLAVAQARANAVRLADRSNSAAADPATPGV